MTTPMRVQLADSLRRRIKDGEFVDEGGKLPSEAELMAESGMSRTTVRAALRDLMNEGILRSASGLGYFVRQYRHFTYRPQADFQQAVEITDTDSFTKAARGRNPTQQIDVSFVRAGEDVARRLRIEQGDLVVRRRRLRFLDGQPYQINSSYYPPDVVEGSPVMDPADINEGVNHVLAERGFAQVRALDEIWVRMPVGDESRLLDLGPGTPVAEHIITGFTADDRPVRMVRVILPGDRNVITFERVHPDHV